MKSLLVSLAFITSSLAQNLPNGGGTSRLQLGIGPSYAQNDDFGDEAGFGLNAEVGILADYQPIDMVWGVRGAYYNGLGDESLDVDIMDVSLMGRVLFPLGADAIKFYGEGRLGMGNLNVSGAATGTVKVGGEKFTFQNDISKDDWTFGWGIGFGVQLDFTQNVGLRIGYDLQSYGDVEALGLKIDPGFIHGGSAALIFKF